MSFAEAAERIHKAVKGLGTDDDALVREVTTHTNDELVKINLEYQKKYEKTMYDAIKEDTSGNYRDLLVQVCMPISDYRAFTLQRAIKGAGTDEDAIIDVFAHATNDEIKEARNAYEFVTGKNLEKELAEDLSGNFEKAVLSLLHLFRGTEAHPHSAAADADEIYKKGEGKWGTDDDFFVKFFTTHSAAHIKLVDAAYNQKYGHNLKKAIDKETSGHYCKLLKALVTPEPEYWADRIYHAVKGLGTDDQLLKRCFVINNKHSKYAAIDEVYRAKHKESLIDAVKGDTSGHYRDVYVGLLQRQR